MKDYQSVSWKGTVMNELIDFNREKERIQNKWKVC